LLLKLGYGTGFFSQESDPYWYPIKMDLIRKCVPVLCITTILFRFLKFQFFALIILFAETILFVFNFHSVDETVKNPRSGQGEAQMPPGGGMGGMGRGRGRPM
jgi:hypothetical protein